MNILAIADRPPTKPIQQILQDNSVDVIITLGDLDQHQIYELEDIDQIPKLGVYGNHDSGTYFEPLKIQNLHLSSVTIKGVTFGGFQGCVRYKEHSNLMYAQEEANEIMKNFPRVDVFLAHCPPFGINDDISEIAHTGFIALKDYVERMEPAYLLHGHTYPDPINLITKYQNTTIVYVHGDKIINIFN